MTPERWLKVEQLFNEALQVPPADRRAWLARTCGDDTELGDEVRSLLDADNGGSGDHLTQSVKAAIQSFGTSPQRRRIGPYELLEQIGRGGMGVVYKAQRADDEYHSIVAIKLVHHGMDTDFALRRFRRERQTLARLTHPSIARLLDGGTTDDGVPYIVMEYIDGVRITDYCEAQDLGLRERLALFLEVCAAVDYAHRTFIVHRDIKPGNILVDPTGTPKLLDFGISKQTQASERQPDQTITQGLAMMTPDYASPEQVREKAITPRSDIYALGTVLYEMLTGVKAHRVDKYTPTAIEEAICQREVPPPSTVVRDAALARRLEGDVDNILLRALQKDPERRYESAAAFADDIRRYLDDLPVLARPDTTIYRARKFVRRHRGLVASTAALFVVLATAAGVALQLAEVAQAREAQVRSLAKVFMFDVHDAILDLPGATKARQTIVETAVQYLDALTASQPSDPELIRELAAGYRRVGDIQGSNHLGTNVGDLAGALASYARARELLDRLIARDARDRQALVDRLRLQVQIAEVHASTEGLPGALVSAATAVDIGHRLLERYPEDYVIRHHVADALMAAGQWQRRAGDLHGSLSATTEALQLLRTLATETGGGDRDLRTSIASGESAVGMTLAQLSEDLEDVLAHYQRAAEEHEALLAMDPQSVALRRALQIDYSHVGDVLGNPFLPNMGDVEGAERAFRKMVELSRQLHDADSSDARARADYAMATMRLGFVIPMERPAEKLAHLEQARALMQSLADESGNVTMASQLAAVERIIANVFRDRGEQAAAVRRYQRSLQLAESLFETGSTAPPRTFVSAAADLARVEAAQGRGATALALLARAQQVAEEQASREAFDDLVGGRVLRPRVYGAMADVHLLMGNADEAARWRAAAQEEWQELATMPGFNSLYRREMETFQDQTVLGS